MNYEELVKALRDIEKTMFALGTSPINMGDVSISLAYDKRWGQTAEAAAAAIEALQAQLPKRGEWIHGKELSRAYIGNCCVGIDYEDFRCSACGCVVEVCEKPKWNYCPNCGAKMTEVQDETEIQG